MGCSSREQIVEVLDAFDDALDRLCELTFDALTTPELLRILERLERAARRQRTPQHALINHLDAQAGQEELGGTLRSALADRLHITKAEASRRIADADDLGATARTDRRTTGATVDGDRGRPTPRPHRRRARARDPPLL